MNATEVHGQTALHWAAAKKHWEAVYLLAQHKATLDTVDHVRPEKRRVAPRRAAPPRPPQPRRA